jgi:hypothetical protein
MSDNLAQLTSLAEKPAAVAWFKGLFHRIHIEMTDTAETFTLEHLGDRVDVTDGFHGDNPNFVVPLESQNLRNLSGFFADDAIDPHEQYRIVKFMLKPCLKAALAMPILQNGAFRKIVRVDTHWQEALLDDQGREDEQVTAIHVNNQWLVIPGYYGRPQRRLVMTPAQLLDFQRRVLETDENGSLAAWLELGRWYVKWRDEVSVPV